ncbi:hypothetical protein M9Y10_024844 [Tritrichomonas musculus]|uniref:HECT domain-containing protein n=1 Tax=Tritrichomonas musculus TaxID=1915356 RepID=A0ABR2GL29_9EUKA
MTDQIPFLLCIKKIQNIIDLERENKREPIFYDALPSEYQNYNDSFSEKLEKYYKKISNLVDVGFAKDNNYFLFNNFSKNFMNSGNHNERHLKTIVHSPHSIYFIYKWLFDILNPIFTRETHTEDIDSILSENHKKIVENLKMNMKFCPKYLKDILSGNHAGIDARNFFDKYILEEILNHPHFFNILSYNERIMLTNEELAQFKTQFIFSFQINLSSTIIQNFEDSPDYLEPLPDYVADLYSTNSLFCLHDFQDLIKISTISDASIEIREANFYEDVKKALVNEEDPAQVDFFNKMKNKAENQDNLKVAPLNEFTKRVNLLYLEYYLNYNIELVSSSFSRVVLYQFIVENQNAREHSINDYIDDPSLYQEDLTKMTLRHQRGLFQRIIDRCRRKEINLSDSQVTTNPKDPLLACSVLLNGMTYKNFMERRNALKIADYEYANLFYLTEFNEQKEIDNYDPFLWYLYKEENNVFNQLVAPFVSSFRKNLHPYNLSRMITKTYLCLYDEYKRLYMQKHLSAIELSREEDKKKFILTLFKLTNPQNVISIYVYLYEYLFSPFYSSIYVNEKSRPYDNIDVAFQILNIIIKFYNVDVSEYCRINHSVINIIIRDEEDLRFALNQIIEDDSRDDVFFANVNNFKKTLENRSFPLSTFRVCQYVAGDIVIRIFNVTINRNCRNPDQITFNNKDGFINFLEGKLNEND